MSARGDQERYYLDDPEDMERLRRRSCATPASLPAPPIDDYEDYSRRGLPEGLRGLSRSAAPRVSGSSPRSSRASRRLVRSSAGRSTNPGSNQTERDAGSVQRRARPTSSRGAIDPSLNLGAREDVAALQILLDRAGASPGVIDGRFGSNVDKAIVAYRSITSENLKSTDTEGIKKALAASGGDPFINYTITAADAAGPFVASVPADYGEKAKLEKLSYTSVTEMLAERFHMDEDYLKALNPGRQFQPRRAPSSASPMSASRRRARSPRIVADKGQKQVLAYDADNKLVVAYPATIGSTDTPSPTGTHLVSRVALDPDYTYNPNSISSRARTTRS